MGASAASTWAERERLIVEHLPLAEAIASRFQRPGEHREDLVQVGALAVVRAVDRRDPGRRFELRSYVARCVEGEIRHYLRDDESPIRVPRRVQEAERRLRGARAELAAVLGREPSRGELALAAGLRPAEVGPGAAAETARRPLELQDDDVGGGEPLDEAVLARALVARAARALAPRERTLVLLRFFLDWSQAEIGDALGISQAQVSRLLDGAMAKMRRRLEPPLALCPPRGGGTVDGDGDRAARADAPGGHGLPALGRPAGRRRRSAGLARQRR